MTYIETMPYKLRKAPRRDAYWVVNKETGAKHSKDPLPLSRAKAQMRALYAAEHDNDLRANKGLKGDGIFSDIFSTVKKYASRVADVVVRGKRQDYPPSVRAVLAKVGNTPIVSMQLRRDPIKAPLNIALNLITQGKFEQAKRKYAYDKLFHLGLEVEIKPSNSADETGRYVIEKNEVINVAPAKPYTNDTETLQVGMGGTGRTINSLLNGARQIQGRNFYNYDAFNNNCQDFIIAVLMGSGLASQSNKAWVKQPIAQVAAELPSYTSRLANIATDIGALANVVIEGRGTRGGALAQPGVYQPPKPYTNAIMQRITDPDYKAKFNAKLKQDYEDRQVRALENARADQERYLEEHMAANPFDRFIRTVGQVGNTVGDVASLLPGPVGKVFGAITTARDALIGEGYSTPRSRFAKQLKAAGVSPEAYLMEAQKKAEDAGLAAHLLGFSDDDKHKLQIPNCNGTIVRFGAVGLGDHILYTLKGDPKADEHRERYLARATKIKGRWKEDAYSPNSLAIAVLW